MRVGTWAANQKSGLHPSMQAMRLSRCQNFAFSRGRLQSRTGWNRTANRTIPAFSTDRFGVLLKQIQADICRGMVSNIELFENAQAHWPKAGTPGGGCLVAPRLACQGESSRKGSGIRRKQVRSLTQATVQPPPPCLGQFRPPDAPRGSDRPLRRRSLAQHPSRQRRGRPGSGRAPGRQSAFKPGRVARTSVA